MTCVRTGMMQFVVSALLTGSAAAAPILDTGASLTNSEFTHGLTVDQIAVLDALSDHGWHLGWFKTHRQAVSSDVVNLDNGITDALFPDGANRVIELAPGFGMTDGNGLVVLGLNTTNEVVAEAVEATAVPEPASLILLGSGAAATVAARRRRQTANASSPPSVSASVPRP